LLASSEIHAMRSPSGETTPSSGGASGASDGSDGEVADAVELGARYGTVTMAAASIVSAATPMVRICPGRLIATIVGAPPTSSGVGRHRPYRDGPGWSVVLSQRVARRDVSERPTTVPRPTRLAAWSRQSAATGGESTWHRTRTRSPGTGLDMAGEE